MADFFSELSRLVRKQWTDPNSAMQEVYATLKSLNPFTLNAPMTINNTKPSHEVPTFTVQQGAGTTPSSGPVKIIVLNGDGSGGTIDTSQGVVTYTPNNPKLPPSQTVTAKHLKALNAGGGGIPGKVASGGPGANYMVDLYENGPSLPKTRTVPVTQLQIASTETIPSGTSCVVSQAGAVFIMQISVWV